MLGTYNTTLNIFTDINKYNNNAHMQLLKSLPIYLSKLHLWQPTFDLFNRQIKPNDESEILQGPQPPN